MGYDVAGTLVEDGSKLMQKDFPVEVRLRLRNPVEDEDPAKQALVEKEMVANVRCDFCKLASKRIQGQLEGRTLKQKHDVELVTNKFCNEKDISIGERLIKDKHYVIFNPEKKRWSLLDLEEQAKTYGSDDVDQSLDPNLRKAMRRSLDTVCEQVVSDSSSEFADHLFKRVSRGSSLSLNLVHEELCMHTNRVCKADKQDKTE